MPYSGICLIAECFISGMFYYRKQKKKVGTFKNMPYTANNAIDGCLIAGFLCSSKMEVASVEVTSEVMVFLMFFFPGERKNSISKSYKALPTDRRTDGRTDTRSYRDARTHLKTKQSVSGESSYTVSSSYIPCFSSSFIMKLSQLCLS